MVGKEEPVLLTHHSSLLLAAPLRHTRSHRPIQRSMDRWLAQERVLLHELALINRLSQQTNRPLRPQHTSPDKEVADRYQRIEAQSLVAIIKAELKILLIGTPA